MPSINDRVNSLDPTQSYSPAFTFDLKNFHVKNIANFKNCPHWDLRAMEQTILLDPDVNESAKVHHVAHSSLELHARDKIFRLKYVRAQDGKWSILPWIPAWADQLFENIFEGWHA